MTTVRALKFERGHHFLPGNKGLPADLALELTAAARVVINILMGCAAKRAYGICWFAIAETIVFVLELPVLLDEGFDNGQLVGKKLLVFGAVEFIVSPLLERDVSADKENKPADLAILFLNDVK